MQVEQCYFRAPIQAIGYAPRQWRLAERGSFIEEIKQTGDVIYRAKPPKRKRSVPMRNSK